MTGTPLGPCGGGCGEGELLDALAAVREAIDIPEAATYGDQGIRDRILVERAGHAAVMLRGILAGDAAPGIPWSAAWLRARLAEHPAAGYQTWDERMAGLACARRAGRPDTRAAAPARTRRRQGAGTPAGAHRAAAPGMAGDAPVIGVLRAAADALAADLATWEARDRADPSPEARRARRSAVAAADAVITSVSRLRDRLEGGRR